MLHQPNEVTAIQDLPQPLADATIESEVFCPPVATRTTSSTKPDCLTLSPEQLRLLLLTAEQDVVFQNLFDVTSIITNTGIKTMELVRLHWDDVDWFHRRFGIRSVGNTDPRYVPFGSKTMQILYERRCRQKGWGYVMGSSSPNALSVVRKQLRAACEQLGIIGCDMLVLRRTFVSRWQTTGACSVSLNRVLGRISYFEFGGDGLDPEERFEIDARQQALLEED